MKITIDTDVLQREHVTVGDFLVLLMGYYETDYKESLSRLIDEGIVQQNLFSKNRIILSDNTKNLVARILTESDSKVADFRKEHTLIYSPIASLLAIYAIMRIPNLYRLWVREDRKSADVKKSA